MELDAALDQPPEERTSPAQRMLDALSLFEDGVAMQRLKLKRRHPSASPEQLEELLRSWLARMDDE